MGLQFLRDTLKEKIIALNLLLFAALLTTLTYTAALCVLLDPRKFSPAIRLSHSRTTITAFRLAAALPQ